MYMDWLKALANLRKKEKAICPICNSDDLEYRLIILNDETRVGYGLIWCNECKRGYHMSRMTLDKTMKDVYHDHEIELPTDIKFE